MRIMLTAQIPVEAGNAALRNGKLAETMKKFIEKWKPEAAYFLPRNGERSCVMVFNLSDASQMPSAVEPFFSQLNADVELTPVMNAEDLTKGLSQIS